MFDESDLKNENKFLSSADAFTENALQVLQGYIKF